MRGRKFEETGDILMEWSLPAFGGNAPVKLTKLKKVIKAAIAGGATHAQFDVNQDCDGDLDIYLECVCEEVELTEDELKAQRDRIAGERAAVLFQQIGSAKISLARLEAEHAALIEEYEPK